MKIKDLYINPKNVCTIKPYIIVNKDKGNIDGYLIRMNNNETIHITEEQYKFLSIDNVLEGIV